MGSLAPLLRPNNPAQPPENQPGAAEQPPLSPGHPGSGPGPGAGFMSVDTAQLARLAAATARSYLPLRLRSAPPPSLFQAAVKSRGVGAGRSRCPLTALDHGPLRPDRSLPPPPPPVPAPGPEPLTLPKQTRPAAATAAHQGALLLRPADTRAGHQGALLHRHRIDR